MTDKKMTCYEIAEPMIAKVTERLAPAITEDQERKQIFKRYCEAFDKMLDKLDADVFSVEIDDTNMTIALCFESMEFIISGAQHLFYQFMERSIKFNMYSVDDSTVGVKFVFPSIWQVQP